MFSIGEVKRGREIGKTQERFAFSFQACATCGKERWVRLVKGQPPYILCMGCAQKARGLALRRENNPHWKGGYTWNRGYKYIIDPRVDETTYIAEHRLIWELEHNCPLPEGFVVHHLNGIKSDNRPCNLTAVARPKHESYTFIHALQNRIQELEAKVAERGGSNFLPL